MSWFKEWLHPSLKCKRKGHLEPKVVRKRIRVIPTESFSRYVVEDWIAEFKECPRCGSLELVGKVEKIDSFTGCTMPSPYWEEMRKNGYLIRD